MGGGTGTLQEGQVHSITSTFGDGTVLPSLVWVSGVAPWPVLAVWITAEVVEQASDKENNKKMMWAQ